MALLISVVIPAFNEQETIGEIIKVLSMLKENKDNEIQEIIVVCDGCTDNTSQIAREKGADKVIELPQNIGKGGAMMEGVRNAKNDIILFLDADLIGLSPGHVKKLIKPVIDGEADMTVGVFEKGRVLTDFAQTIAPFLSGQRAVRKHLLEGMSDLDAARFGVEIALTRYAIENKLKVKEVVLEDMSHRMKEEKFGLVKGISARLRMYREIAQYMRKHLKI
ncbi:MAG: glycosyltransferase family 2 protein [Clostridia bacterium]|nr:glycosyltransferase family 2 protein [Clostridia bacterium]